MLDLRAQPATVESRLLSELARASRYYRPRRGAPAPYRHLEKMDIIEPSAWLQTSADYNETRLVERYLSVRERFDPCYQALFQYSLSDEFVAARASREPTLLLFWHCGILRSTFSALAAMGPDLTLIKSGRVLAEQSAQLKLLLTDESATGSALANARLLKTAVKSMRAGNMVATFMDGTEGLSSSTARFFGKPIRPRGSVELLASRADARVFPCVSHWSVQDKRLELLVGAELSQQEGESESLLQLATDWFASHLTRNLCDLTAAALHLLNHDPTKAAHN